MTEANRADERLPKVHGWAGCTTELIDLNGAVARIKRTTYATKPGRWTELTLMVPPDHDHNVPGGFLTVTLNADTLNKLVEQLAWPT